MHDKNGFAGREKKKGLRYGEGKKHGHTSRKYSYYRQAADPSLHGLLHPRGAKASPLHALVPDCFTLASAAEVQAVRIANHWHWHYTWAQFGLGLQGRRRNQVFAGPHAAVAPKSKFDDPSGPSVLKMVHHSSVGLSPESGPAEAIAEGHHIRGAGRATGAALCPTPAILVIVGRDELGIVPRG